MADKKTFSIQIDGIKQSVDGVENLGSAVNTNVSSIKELRTALKATKDEMAGLDKNTKQWQDLAKVAGDYKDRIDDINQATARFASDTKALDDAINIGQTMVSTFTLAKGAMSAFGLETEGAVEAIQKLQGAMAIIQSLQSLQNTLKGSTAATDALAKAQGLLTKAMGTGSVAAKTLRGALLAIPLMLIIGLVTELVLHWEDVVGWFQKTFPVLNNLTQKISAFGSALKKFMIDLPSQAADVLKKLFSGKFQEAMDSAKKILSNFKNNFWNSYNEEMTVKAAEEGLKRTQQEIAELEISERNNKTHSKKLIELKKKEFEQRRALAKGNKEELNKIKLDEMKFFGEVEDKKTKVAQENAKAREAAAKKAAQEEEKRQKELFEAQKKRLEEIKRLNEELHGERKKTSDLIYESDKIDAEEAKRRIQLQIKEEKNLKKKNELYEDLKAVEIELVNLQKSHNEAKIFEEVNDKLGGVFKNIDEFKAEIEGTSDKVTGFSQTELTYFNNAALQMENEAKRAKNAIKSINDEIAIATKPEEKKRVKGQKDENGEWRKWSELTNEEREERVQIITQASVDLAIEAFDTITDGFMQMMDFEVEKAQEALDEVTEMHEEQVEKVNESQEKIAELNQKMRDASGSQLEQYKQQMADEREILNQREAEEKRLEKEKEKRQKELEKQEKKRRKAEAAAQIVQAAINIALAVTKAMTTLPPPASYVLAAVTSALGLAQLAIMTKNYQKMAEGGLLKGKSHSQGGIPVGNTGVEVEGGEYVVNKRSTAKYLPLLQQINEEGARKKTVANQIGKYADGGQLNMDRISSTLDSINTAKMVSEAINSIDMHPVVSVVDINRGQRNYTEVRQLAGAKD